MGMSPPQITTIKSGHNTKNSYLTTTGEWKEVKFWWEVHTHKRRILQRKFPIFAAWNLVGKVVCRTRWWKITVPEYWARTTHATGEKDGNLRRKRARESGMPKSWLPTSLPKLWLHMQFRLKVVELKRQDLNRLELPPSKCGLWCVSNQPNSLITRTIGLWGQ